MKKLMLALAAGVFVLTAASFASASMSSSYFDLNAIDPSGLTVVAVHSPGYSLETVSAEKIYLDSNRLWAVNNIRSIGFSRPLTAERVGKGRPVMYCFDSTSRFCANAY